MPDQPTPIQVLIPGADSLEGGAPIVIVGPNGSGKTRNSRQIMWDDDIVDMPLPREGDVIAASRISNFNVTTSATVAAAEDAYASTRRMDGWGMTQPSMDGNAAAQVLLSRHTATAQQLLRHVREHPGSPVDWPPTALETLLEIWANLFPGRRVEVGDWTTTVRTEDELHEIEYPSDHLSDGEKSAFYLAARVLLNKMPLLIVDEPEIHLHHELAVRLWDELEGIRSDVTMVYVTHSLPFALSRKGARFLISSPSTGLSNLDIDDDIPDDIAAALLGSATLSFHATRVVFCEGDATSLDKAVYGAWFDGQDTVIKPVGSCDQVIRCVAALNRAAITVGLHPTGIIDSDFHPDEFAPPGVLRTSAHEIESLLLLPGLVAAVCRHMGHEFDELAYSDALRQRAAGEARQTVVTRWKQAIEWEIEKVTEEIRPKDSSMSIGDWQVRVPAIFASASWPFDPTAMLADEERRVNEAIQSGPLADVLRLIPGKPLSSALLAHSGLRLDQYVGLLTQALTSAEPTFAALKEAIEAEWTPRLPPRRV